MIRPFAIAWTVIAAAGIATIALFITEAMSFAVAAELAFGETTGTDSGFGLNAGPGFVAVFPNAGTVAPVVFQAGPIVSSVMLVIASGFGLLFAQALRWRPANEA